MKALEDAGVKVHVLPIDEDIDESVIDSLMSVQFYGAVSFSFEPVIKYLKEKGVKIVYDMDDALRLIDVTNPFYHTVLKDIGSVNELLEYADEVTVSTPQMKEYVEDTYAFKGKVTIIPNSFLKEEWGHKRKEHHHINIGFAGASPHVSDLIDIIPVISTLQKRYDIKFYIMGFGQSDYQTWYKQYRYIAQPEATRELRKLDELLSTIKYEWVPFVDHTLYPKVLTELSLDIGICPLKSTSFNNHRSACKAMEYTLSGALAIASDTIPYRKELNSVLVNEWEETLEFYITHHEVRKKMVEEHLEWTQENRDITKLVDLLKEVYVV